MLGVEAGLRRLQLGRLVHDVERAPVPHLTIHISPQPSRILMDGVIESVNTLRAGQITHDVPWRQDGRWRGRRPFPFPR